MNKNTAQLLNAIWNFSVFFLLVFLGLLLDDVYNIQKFIYFPFNLIGAIPIFIGVIILDYAGRTLERFGKGTSNPLKPPKYLVTTGPYAYSRNPQHLSGFFIKFGISILFGSLSMIFLTFIYSLAFHFFIVLWEEKVLLKRFGKEYQQYKKKVPRWIPNFSHKRKL